MPSAELRQKVEQCYQEVMLKIQKVGEGMQAHLKARRQIGCSDGSFAINGRPVSDEMMIGALEAYAFERPTHHGITIFPGWDTERGEERIRAALASGVKFLRGIPFSGFDENGIDDDVWEFITGSKDKPVSRIQVLQPAISPEQAEMGRLNCQGLGSCGN